MGSIAAQIATELKVNGTQVQAAIKLIDEGATIPFIARYRKEATGGLDDTQLRNLDTRLSYLRELNDRKATILNTIQEQGKLTDELKKALEQASTKNEIEDLYLPYKPKRRTKAAIAKEAGLSPLAERLLNDPNVDETVLANEYINDQVSDAQAALDGAKHILMEQFSENAHLLSELRAYVWKIGIIRSSVVKGKESAGKKFSDYFEFSQTLSKVPSHRLLALLRGRRESYLNLSLDIEDVSHCEHAIAKAFSIDLQAIEGRWLEQVIQLTWKIKLHPKLELELLNQAKEAAEMDAIGVFASNLKDLLLLAPAGNKVTIGLDPGIRTGVKVVVIDGTGKLLDYTTIYPLQPQNQWHESIVELAKLITKFNVELISIGNGTGSRETDRLCNELATTYKDLSFQKIMVNEAGASIYSASELAAKEFPDLDVSLRGAVSIARRVQDPLAELVKIEPKSIGVGQYQHDVNQVQLAKRLDAVVEDCVNLVGVDLNTASPALLKYVAGLNEGIAQNIVLHRDTHGAFASREQLMDVTRMGDKTFQQAAGFLRIPNANNPLDNSAVHPESYTIVEKITHKTAQPLAELIGNHKLLDAINAQEFVSDEIGLPTLNDILQELKKPGRDPRPEFKTAQFKEGVETIKDLTQDMILEGVVSNVTNFGAFVDIGVHQDGLVHISELTNKFITDPRQVVKAGDIVTVKVIELDLERKRIGLSMKLEKSSNQQPTHKPKKRPAPKKTQSSKSKPLSKQKKLKSAPIINSAMADAFAKLKGD